MKEAKRLIIQYIESHEAFESNKPIAFLGSNKLSLMQIREEVLNDTEAGEKIIDDIITLAVTMLFKDFSKQ